MISKTALIFPGLGIQYPGMTKEFCNDIADEFNEKARHIIGTLPWVLTSSKIMQYWSLRRIDYSQLAIFVSNHAIYELLAKNVPKFKDSYVAVAGHSLGQCNAIIASGAISFEEALPVVHKIGSHAYKASKKLNGSLMAIRLKNYATNINPQLEELETFGIYPALFNTPNQIILGGPRNNIRNAVEKMNFDGISAIDLHLNLPYHTSYMKPTADSVRDIIYSIELRNPTVPIYANSSAEPISNPQEVYEEIYSQIFKPVNWEGTIVSMLQDGIERFIVIGPDKKERTKHTIKTINSDVEVLTLNGPKSLEAIVRSYI